MNIKFKTDPKRWRQYVSYFDFETVGGFKKNMIFGSRGKNLYVSIGF